MLRRRAARLSTEHFTAYTTPGWQAAKIHKAICAQLDRVERGYVDRLMLLCPPQHGKSKSASERFPARVLGADATRDVISASATAQLAERFGRSVRNCIASPEYKNLFPQTTLAEDSQAKGQWSTAQGGSYFAVGIGGALMGRGANLAVIDDPFATWDDAQSELTRDNVWEWYTGTLYNRVRPGGSIILIQHRMHEDDLAGRLIEKHKDGTGDKWEIVELPAHLHDPPWPERYDRDALERLKSISGPRKWSALYLQNPTPDEGTFFQRGWFEFVDPKAFRGHRYTTGDFAVTEDGGDFTEIGTHGYAGDTLTLALDGWRGQTAADEWIERVIDQFTHKPFCFFGEGGPIRRAIEPFLKRRMAERKTFCRLEWLPRSHDKPTMARPLQAMASSGKVKIADTEYGHHLLNQLLQFPAGKLDDAVDMAALMGMAIDQAHPAMIAAVPKPAPVRDGYTKAKPEDSWRTA